jgi:nifR3 family TIM-barrel protein
MLKIGNKKIETNIFLAPLSGCSDLAFRMIAREHGAKFCFFEMVDSHSMIYNRKRTLSILKTDEKDRPIAGQLLGRDPSIMLEAALKMLELVDMPFIDINCACPAKKVIKKKAGSYLLKDTESLYKVVKKLASSLPVPVTVKLRIGFDKKDAGEIAETAKRCESSGAAAIFVHGRTREQGYRGDIDHASIKAIKDAVGIPVIGGGNIFSPELAKKMFTETGCDGIFVARGAFGNPWIFNDIERYIKTGRLPSPVSAETRKEVLEKHLSYIETYKEMRPASRVNCMRKAVIWYVKSLPHASRIRDTACRARSYEEMVDIVDKI